MTPRCAAAIAVGVLAAAAIGYAGSAVLCVRRFGRRPTGPPPGDAQAVSVLVPLHGSEPGLAENLAALVAQDHPAPVQLVLGVHARDDPAYALAEAVRLAHPDRDLAVVVSGAPRVAGNPKVANLVAMYAHARHDRIVLVDSDMRVDAAYVRSVTAPLARPAVGAVTCLYAATPGDALPARLGAAFVNEQFVPSALVASALGPLRHGYGATIALRRAVLDEIGGLAVLAGHLADDHVLGRRIAERGYRVELSPYLPRTSVGETTWGALWRHEVRWHRTIRAVQPWGYAGMVLTYPLPLALAALALAPGRVTTALLPAALLVRAALRAACARAFGVRPLPLALLPLRDLLGFAVWLRGLGGGSVEWRGTRLTLAAGDELS